MGGGTPRPRIVPAQGPQGSPHHTQLGDPMSRMCAGPGPYRAVLVCWAQPALHVILAPVGVHALESITQKYERAAGARRVVSCAPELSEGPHLGQGVLWGAAGGPP